MSQPPDPNKPGESSTPARKQTHFTAAEREILLKKFDANKFPTADERRQIAVELRTSPSRVKNWFQNQRANVGSVKKERVSDAVPAAESDTAQATGGVPELQPGPSSATGHSNEDYPVSLLANMLSPDVLSVFKNYAQRFNRLTTEENEYLEEISSLDSNHVRRILWDLQPRQGFGLPFPIPIESGTRRTGNPAPLPPIAGLAVHDGVPLPTYDEYEYTDYHAGQRSVTTGYLTRQAQVPNTATPYQTQPGVYQWPPQPHPTQPGVHLSTLHAHPTDPHDFLNTYQMHQGLIQHPPPRQPHFSVDTTQHLWPLPHHEPPRGTVRQRIPEIPPTATGFGNQPRTDHGTGIETPARNTPGRKPRHVFTGAERSYLNGEFQRDPQLTQQRIEQLRRALPSIQDDVVIRNFFKNRQSEVNKGSIRELRQASPEPVGPSTSQRRSPKRRAARTRQAVASTRRENNGSSPGRYASSDEGNYPSKFTQSEIRILKKSYMENPDTPSISREASFRLGCRLGNKWENGYKGVQRYFARLLLKDNERSLQRPSANRSASPATRSSPESSPTTSPRRNRPNMSSSKRSSSRSPGRGNYPSTFTEEEIAILRESYMEEPSLPHEATFRLGCQLGNKWENGYKRIESYFLRRILTNNGPSSPNASPNRSASPAAQSSRDRPASPAAQSSPGRSASPAAQSSTRSAQRTSPRRQSHRKRNNTGSSFGSPSRGAARSSAIGHRFPKIKEAYSNNNAVSDVEIKLIIEQNNYNEADAMDYLHFLRNKNGNQHTSRIATNDAAHRQDHSVEHHVAAAVRRPEVPAETRHHADLLGQAVEQSGLVEYVGGTADAHKPNGTAHQFQDLPQPPETFRETVDFLSDDSTGLLQYVAEHTRVLEMRYESNSGQQPHGSNVGQGFPSSRVQLLFVPPQRQPHSLSHGNQLHDTVNVPAGDQTASGGGQGAPAGSQNAPDGGQGAMHHGGQPAIVLATPPTQLPMARKNDN